MKGIDIKMSEWKYKVIGLNATVKDVDKKEYESYSHVYPCGDFYDVASDQKECVNMISKPCAGCMFNQKRKASLGST